MFLHEAACYFRLMSERFVSVQLLQAPCEPYRCRQIRVSPFHFEGTMFEPPLCGGWLWHGRGQRWPPAFDAREAQGDPGGRCLPVPLPPAMMFLELELASQLQSGEGKDVFEAP